MSERKIVEYHMVATLDIKFFNECINEKLSIGFELYGTPFVDRDGNVHQAMVRYEDE